jgi:cytochrome c553
MKRLLLAGWMLSWPLLGWSANSAQQEFARVIASKPDLAHGQELFQQCAACHGPDGGGQVSGSIPRIAGQHYRVLVRQVIDFRHGTRWDFRMEGVATSHEVIPELQDIADVTWYVSQLSRDGARGIGDGEYVERGKSLYAERCASCHGPQADGDDKKGIPRIAGQHAGYLARQIYDAVDNRRPLLARSHGKYFKPMDFQDVLGLSDYLSRIGWKNEAVPADSAPPTH